MTARECGRIAKAYDMLVDWIGAGHIWWPDLQEDSPFWNDAACILQQLIAEYEELT